MQSNISRKLEMEFPPIVMIKTNTKPKNAVGPKTDK